MTQIIRLMSVCLPCTCSGLLIIILLKTKHFFGLYYPIDCHARWKGKRVFGDNKTFFGLFIHLIVCTAVCWFLNLCRHLSLAAYIHPLFDYNFFLLGVIYGGGYELGELLNSFVKRRLNIKPGQKATNFWQSFFDLNDGPLTIVSLLYLLAFLTLPECSVVFCLAWSIHASTDFLMRRLKLKK